MVSTPVIRLAGALAASGLLVAACGSDGDSASGDVDAFCAEFAASESVDLDEDFEAGMAEMERIRDLAPGEVRDDIDVLMDAFRQLEDLDVDDDADMSEEDFGEGFAAVMALMFSPEVMEATENLETFAVDECGLDPDELDGDDDGITVSDGDGSIVGGDVSVSFGDDDAEPVGPLVSEAAEGVPDPLFDPFFDDEVDLGVASYEGAQYYLDVNHTDAPWRTRLGSWTFLGVAPPTLEAGGLDLTDDEALEVCAALAAYLVDFDPDGTVTVSTYDQNDDGTFGQPVELVSVTASDGC